MIKSIVAKFIVVKLLNAGLAKLAEVFAQPKIIEAFEKACDKVAGEEDTLLGNYSLGALKNKDLIPEEYQIQSRLNKTFEAGNFPTKEELQKILMDSWRICKEQIDPSETIYFFKCSEDEAKPIIYKISSYFFNEIAQIEEYRNIFLVQGLQCLLPEDEREIYAFESYKSTDKEGLYEAILGDSLSDNIPIEQIPHPKIDKIKIENGESFQLIGKSGSGKSVALWQMLTSLPETEIILITSLDDSDTWTYLKKLLQQPDPRYVFVIDDLQDKILSQGSGMLSNLCMWAKSLPNVNIFMAYRSTKRQFVEQNIQSHTWKQFGFRDIELDNPPREFISKIVSLICDAFNISIAEKIKEGFINGIIEWENTPACAVSSLFPYKGTYVQNKDFFPVSLEERESVWREEFKKLDLADRSTEINVLQSISALRESGLKKNPVKTVYEIFEKVTGGNYGGFDIAIQKLLKAGWLRLKDNSISGHDMQIQAKIVGLVVDGKPTAWIDRYRDILLRNEFDTLQEHRTKALHSLARFYWHIDKIDICEELLSKLFEECSDDLQALCNRGICRIRLQRQEEGLSDIRNAVSNAPDNFGFFEILFFSLIRLEYKDEVDRIFEERLKQNPGEMELLKFSSLAHSHIPNKKRELECAKRLWEIEESPHAATTLLEATKQTGSKSEVKKLLNKFIKRWPNDSQLQILAAAYYRSRGDMAKALELAQNAVFLAPNKPGTYLMYAWLLSQEGRFIEADKIIEKGLTIAPKYPGLKAIKGVHLLQSNNHQDALPLLTDALEKFETIPTVMIDDICLAKGEALILCGNNKDADDAFKLAQKYGSPLWSCEFRKAHALKKLGKHNEAIKIFEKCLKDSDAEEMVYLELADSYSELKNHKKAEKILRKANKLFPDNPKIIINLITQLSFLSRFKEALSLAKKLIKISPDESNFHRTLGLTYNNCHKYEDAIKSFDNAISTNPNDYEIVFDKARSFSFLEQWEDAVNCYSLARKLSPEKHFKELIYEGICLNELNRFDEAVELFDQALILNANVSNLHYFRGCALLKLKDYSQALNSFNNATEIFPEYRQAWLEKSRAFMFMNDYESAADSLENAFVFKPPNERMLSTTKNQDSDEILFRVADLGYELCKLAPESSKVLSVCLKLNYAVGWFEGVLNLAGQILDKEPDNYDALLFQARAYNRWGDMSYEDDNVYKDMLTKALKTTEQISLKKEHGELLLQKIFALAGLQMKNKVLKHFEEVKSLNIPSSDDWSMAGLALARLEIYEAALHALNLSLQYDPENMNSLRGKASVLASMNKFDDVKQILNTMLSINPYDVDALRYRAEISKLCEDYKSAEKDYKSIIKIDKNDAKAHFDLAAILSDSKKAMKYYKKSIKLDSNFSIAHRRLGILEFYEGQLEKSLKNLTKAIELSPDDFNAHNIRAFVFEQLGKKEEAHKEYETSLSIQDNPIIRNMYSHSLINMGKIKIAKQQQALAFNFFSGKQNAHEELSQLLYKSGLNNAILYHLKKIIELEPDNSSNYRLYANFCVGSGHSEEAEEYYLKALKLEETSAQNHADYAVHLVNTRDMEKAVAHINRAFELNELESEQDLDFLVQLTDTSFKTGHIPLIVSMLNEAFPLVEKKQHPVYNAFKSYINNLKQYIKEELEKNKNESKEISASLCYLGILSHIQGNIDEAHSNFRKASIVAQENREFAAVVNWGNFLVDAIEANNSKIQNDEIDEAIIVFKEMLHYCQTDDERTILEKILQQLEDACNKQPE